MVFQRVMAVHESLAGLLLSLEVPIWSWSVIAMYFVAGLHST
jgi:hypothetical protein